MCIRDRGRYSLYDVEDQNWLRGVQVADDVGLLAFTTVFPGTYPGRWPHAHFEVYPDLATATGPDTAITVSQLALPQEACAQVYAQPGYGESATHLTEPIDDDMVFADGYDSQLATTTGTVAGGYTARLTVPVAA